MKPETKLNVLRYLPLLIPLYLSLDFIPIWYAILYGILITLLVFIRLPKYFAYLNFINIYLIFKSVGPTIIPETMIPLLAVFLVSQIITNRVENKFEIYPLFLWIGVFAIFSANLYYLSYALLHISILFFFQESSGPTSIKNIIKNIVFHRKQILFIGLLTFFLFLFFPRFHNFLPTSNSKSIGKIGYSEQINNSGISELALSNKTAFFAELKQKLPAKMLYWRGRVFTHTDGYNWKFVEPIPEIRPVSNGKNLIYQKLKYEQDFNGDIILLNSPVSIIETNLNYYHIPATNEFKSYNKHKKTMVMAFSELNPDIHYQLRPNVIAQYTQAPPFIPKQMKSFLKTIDAVNASEIILQFKQTIIKEKFTYTLTPGALFTLADFLKRKKGYCTHFASLLGLTLRLKGIPTRLVSGFQGGEYNPIGKYYVIKTNDAHAWVEFYDNNRWNTIDPTSFISPDRIQLGGTNYFNQDFIAQNGDRSYSFSFFIKTKQYFDNLNYRVSLLLDNYSREQQKKISNALHLNNKLFFVLGVLLILALFVIYYFIRWPKHKQRMHTADKLLQQVDKKLKLPGLRLAECQTILEMKKLVGGHPQQEKLLKIINTYQEYRYSNKDLEAQLRILVAQISK